MQIPLAQKRNPLVGIVCMLLLSACAGRPQRSGRSLTTSRWGQALSTVDASEALSDAEQNSSTNEISLRELAVSGALCGADAGRVAPSLHREEIAPQLDPWCGGGYEDQSSCDTVDHAPERTDACYVSNDHIQQTELSIRTSTRSSTPPTANTATPWDHRTAPQRFDLVNDHLHFTPQEQATLNRNGFVALGRESVGSYAMAYHEIFRQQLPVFVSVDSILHAIFQSHGSLLQNIEVHNLAPKLGRILSRLRAALRSSERTLSANLRNDLDVYLTVAARLLDIDFGRERTLFHNDAQVRELLRHIDLPHHNNDDNHDRDDETIHVQADSALQVELFGRSRMLDFSQFIPRGHYATTRDSVHLHAGVISLEAYFRAMIWLSLLEFNLVSRSCRSSQPGAVPDSTETPREAIAALGLAELAERAGVLSDIAEFERMYQLFAGHREDVSLQELLRLERAGHFRSSTPNAFAQLRTAIGSNYQRTARVHVMPQGASTLPAIATMFGPRIVPDIGALERVVHDRIEGRTRLGFADVGYALGHNRARTYLAADLQHYPTLQPALDGARDALTQGAASNGDLYRHWLQAIVALSGPHAGVEPTFMGAEAWQDFRLNSALVGYGQIRHNYTLLAGQGYDNFGCEIPDGYVEPAVEVYDALLEFVRVATTISPTQGAYFQRVSTVLQTLRAIALTERSGAALSETQKRWLGMVSEYIPGGNGDSPRPPKWTGWYFDLFPDREIGAEKTAEFVADYFTLTNTSTVMYLGAERPRMAAFVVDTNGPPRMMVGPVARGYETSAPITTRLNDETARTSSNHSAPWRTSYMVETRGTPPALETVLVQCGEGLLRMAIRGALHSGVAEVTLLDHHSDALTQSNTVTLSDGPAYVSFEATTPNTPEYVHVSVRSAEGDQYQYTLRLRGALRCSEENEDCPARCESYRNEDNTCLYGATRNENHQPAWFNCEL